MVVADLEAVGENGNYTNTTTVENWINSSVVNCETENDEL